MSIPVFTNKIWWKKMNLLFQATIKCLETPEEKFERDSRVYNIQAVSFTPAELVEEMKKHFSNFVVEYHPDERQAIGGCGFDN